MTVAELRELMVNIIEVLQQNKAAMTPEVLAMASKIITMIRESPTYLQIVATVLGTDVEQVKGFLDSGDKLIEVEKKLVTTNMTDQLIKVLTNLQDRTVVLTVIAGLL